MGYRHSGAPAGGPAGLRGRHGVAGQKIIHSRYPALQAAEALGLIVPRYLLLFATTYFVMQRASAANFTQPLTRTDALYFTVTVFSTVSSGTSPPNPRQPA